MLWPAFITGGYHPRYLYEAMPFVLLFFMVIFKGYGFYIRPGLGLLLSFYVFLNIQCFDTKQKNLATIRHAFEELVCNNDLQNQPILIIGTPTKPFGTGLPNLLHIMQNNNQHPIYFDCMMPTTSTPLKKDGCILKINNLESTNAYTIGLDRYNNIHIVGAKPLPIINPCYGTCENLTKWHSIIKINKEILDQNPLIITWDYKNNTFNVLSKSRFDTTRKPIPTERRARYAIKKS